MDMLMTMFIVLALYSFWKLYEGTGVKRHEILLPVWIFLALFTKGPVGLLMPPVSIVCFLLVKQKGRDIGKYLGWKTWGIIAALCLVWFTGVYFDGGMEYLNNLLFHQTFGRAVNSFHHKAPFWYYLVAIWYIVAPYMFLLIGAVAASLVRFRKEEREDRETFFLVTIRIQREACHLHGTSDAVHGAAVRGGAPQDRLEEMDDLVPRRTVYPDRHNIPCRVGVPAVRSQRFAAGRYAGSLRFHPFQAGQVRPVPATPGFILLPLPCVQRKAEPLDNITWFFYVAHRVCSVFHAASG